ncbi:MAG: S-layer homology domain-containing protein, partial [Clostridia bacterium]|nr:S-layer homology domain-containing protein [Clostridia bacterium]
AQIVVQLVETVLDEKLAKAPEDTFYDCSDEAVLKAYKAGIINGIGDDKFDPKSGVSREQLATMLWRAVEYIQRRGTGKELKKGAGLDGYTDKESVSDYAVEAVAALAENGIMKGTSETTLSPQDGCTVEQSVLLVYRLFDKLK